MNENSEIVVSFGLDEFLTYGAIWMAIIWVMWAAIWAYQSASDRRQLQEHSNDDELEEAP